MAVLEIPKIGDRLYLMNRQVIVTKIYANFQLIKVRYIEDSIEFLIDGCAVTKLPDNTKTISLGMLSHSGR